VAYTKAHGMEASDMRNMRQRVDPEIVPVLDELSEIGLLEFDFSDVPALRARLNSTMEMMAAQEPRIEGVDSTDHRAPCTDGSHGVSVRVYEPSGRSETLPALLWVHGGGYVLGSIEWDDQLARQFALSLDCVVASVGYRLAPEHPFPTPLEDCYAALTWLSEEAQALGVDRARIAIGGASAGGGLAAALAQLARDRGEVSLVYQLLIYPMLDDRNITQPSDTVEDTVVWKRADNLFGWRSYLGHEPGTENTPPYASPGRTESLERLPPAYVLVGDIDLFTDEDIEYARRLAAAGVPTELHVYPGGVHGFDSFGAATTLGTRANAHRDEALKHVLHGAST
jgi:acetyl esterase/lipase